jgi:hypothetical protein
VGVEIASFFGVKQLSSCFPDDTTNPVMQFLLYLTVTYRKENSTSTEAAFFIQHLDKKTTKIRPTTTT